MRLAHPIISPYTPRQIIDSGQRRVKTPLGASFTPKNPPSAGFCVSGVVIRPGRHPEMTMQSMRKSLLIAALGACLPMFMSDVQASSASDPESPNDAGGASGEQSPGATSAADASVSGNAGEAGNALTPVGSSMAAELPADGTTLVPNAPVSDAETQSAQSIGVIAADASGATDVATLDADVARHPAHTWLDLLEAELKTNPFAAYARELVAKVRAVL